MSTKYKILIGGIIAIVLLDTVGSITSRTWDYGYESLAPISYLIYAFVGFLMHKYVRSLKSAGASGVILGLFDTTVGWWISIVFDANFSNNMNLETPVIIVTILVVPIILGMIAFMGGVLSKVVDRLI